MSQKLAYHATTFTALPAIKAYGIRPHAERFRRGAEPLVFFSNTASEAYRYFMDREDGALLRFPWPLDAVGGVDEYTSKASIDPMTTEIFTGRALDPVANLYWIGDIEERFARFSRYDTRTFNVRIEQSRTWKPLAVF